MKTKVTLAALVLAFTPALAMAGGCAGGHAKQTASCQIGTVWDADKSACVADVAA